MKNKQAPLEPDCMYHVFSRANGIERVFKSEENYQFFLQRYKQFIQPIAETFCYCLMPNHFHFLIRVREEKVLKNLILGRKVSSKTLQGFRTLEGLEKQKAISQFLTQQFSHLLNAYSQAFNKEQNRRGSLFMHPYKRIKITEEQHLLKLVRYIHHNPTEAALCAKVEDWKYSSYKTILSSAPSMVNRAAVMEWFGNKANFKDFHNQAL